MPLGGRDHVVPHAESGRQSRGDTRLVDWRKPARLAVSLEERRDIAHEAVDPRAVNETGEVVRQTEVQKLNDRFQPGRIARRKRTVPQRPVVHTRLGLGKPPRRAVPHDLDTQRSDRREVGLHVVVVIRCSELVLAITLALAHHERVGTLLADRPDEVRKRI